MHNIIKVAGIATLMFLAGCANPTESTSTSLHEELLVLDTHLDTPLRMMYPGFDITRRHDPELDYSSVDLPRMREGGLDGGFWVIWTPQGPLTPEGYANARDMAILRANRTREMLARHPEHFEIALRAADASRIAAAGKRIVYQSIENAYPLGEDLSLMDTFYKLGVRMISPVHSRNNQFADSSTDVSGTPFGGLSPLGEALVRKANDIGMILDGSHAHDRTLEQMIDLSATPIVLSHTGAKDVFNHPRNIDDALLKKLAASGGVIQMNALGAYMRTLRAMPERWQAYGALDARYPEPRLMTAAQEARYFIEKREIDAGFDKQSATFEDYMDHFLHVLRLIGPDHVGVGADWDGGGGVDGMRDITALPKITERLLAEGYSRADLEKIWGGNVLRVLAEVEEFAQRER